MLSAFKRKQDEEKMRMDGRLPPGQSLTQRFPVLHVGPVPNVDLNTWDLKFWGLLEEPLTLNWEAFNQLPKTKINMDLHCVTKWSMFDTEWEGVTLKTIIEAGLLKILPQAKYVLQHAEYGYTTNLPLSVMLQENFLLATMYNGQPIPPDHGYPLRAVIGAVRTGMTCRFHIYGREPSGCGGCSSCRKIKWAFGKKPDTTTRPMSGKNSGQFERKM